jgi:hypothetical protein
MSFGGGVFLIGGYDSGDSSPVMISYDSGRTWQSPGLVSVTGMSEANFSFYVTTPGQEYWLLGGSKDNGTAWLQRSDWLEAGAGIVEQGSNSNGNYIRFSSGIQICYMRIAESARIDNPWGGIYVCDIIAGSVYPKAFSALPSVSMFSVNASDSRGNWIMGRTSGSITATPGFYLVRAPTASAQTYYVSSIAIGEWA